MCNRLSNYIGFLVVLLIVPIMIFAIYMDAKNTSIEAGNNNVYDSGLYEESLEEEVEELEEIEIIEVEDFEAPNISLIGDEILFVEIGEKFIDPGCEVFDEIDKSLKKAEIKGAVDVNNKGMYVLTYEATDRAGNMSSVSRTVLVYEAQKDITDEEPTDKTVYLTFDDGPGEYTEELLDILDRYNVKVTFFVTNQYDKYEDLIKEEYERGHTVAIHSYSHKYPVIYENDYAFYDDIEIMANICESHTGVRPSIIRFPGGSSNTVSASYNVGIMSRLTKEMEYLGYKYCDWNVASGDGGETNSTSEIYNNVINGMRSHKISYVLQHDTKKYSVDAVENIIVWGLANGYTFMPLTENSPMTHHGINN